MIDSVSILRTACTDPYRNLALEACLLRQVQKGRCVLYLWQNAPAVVFGRNQNPWAEVDPEALAREGVKPVRRLSGGGAVYHDAGNLNFTFLTKAADADKDRETEVILRAVQNLGIPAEKTGRNDLVCEGRKFSGHAYYRAGDAVYHHGTLMLRVDLTRLQKCLRVSPLKLEKRGVASVRSRVMNLSEIVPGITPETMAQALEAAFRALYPYPETPLRESDLDPTALAGEEVRFASAEWIWGPGGPLPLHAEARFADGLFRLDYETSINDSGQSCFGRVILSTDALETNFDFSLAERLQGCPLRREDAAQALGGKAASPEGQRILALIERIGAQHDL